MYCMVPESIICGLNPIRSGEAKNQDLARLLSASILLPGQWSENFTRAISMVQSSHQKEADEDFSCDQS